MTSQETIDQKEYDKETSGTEAAEEAAKRLLFGKFEPLEQMTVEQLKQEVQTWRNIWSWVPSAIKYYISRTGALTGITIRNYHRYIGVLLETHWDLKELELGVYERVYDQNSGEYYYERKVVKVPVSQIIALDWIAERTPEKELQQEAQQEQNEAETLES